MTETNNTVIQTECSNTTRYISINNPPPPSMFPLRHIDLFV